MRTLVVFYSRTGHTRLVAEEIRNNLDCDMEEIFDTKNRSGMLGLLGLLKDRNQKFTVLKDLKNDPSDYDLLIIGTPVWGDRVSIPVRTYIHQNQEKFKNVAFFSTAGGDKFDGVFKEMKELCQASPVKTLGVSGKALKDDTYKSKVAEFVEKIQ